MTEAILTKTTSVLNLHAGSRHRTSFASVDDDTGAIDREVWMSGRTWEELGGPEQITVTIKPGDRLNA